MKKSLFCFVFLLLTNFLALGQDSISVLFIGNSYTYVNDLPGTLDSLAASLGKSVLTGSKVNGGYTFQNHANDPQTYTAIHQYPWDVVVIQGQSQEPSFPTDQVTIESLPYAVQLADSVYAHSFCSNVLFFMTWGRETGDPQWDSINTFDKMNGRLYQSYMRIADSSDAMVAPVGAVWKYVRDHYPAIDLYAGDGSHPSLAGTYLAACTFYTALFTTSPQGSSYLGGLDQATASLLQDAAATVMLDSLDHFLIHSVDAPTQASFVWNPSGASVVFTSTSIHAQSWQWSFGDGQTGVAEQVSNTYSASGNYTVQLIASSVCNSDTLTKELPITVLGVHEPEEGIFFQEFPDHFEITSSNEPLMCQILTLNGGIIQSEKIPTNTKTAIQKPENGGVILLINSQKTLFSKKFVFLHY